ncbi:MAG: hypothetical protein AAF664_24045, partial [Planctomycetota bacterium]
LKAIIDLRELPKLPRFWPTTDYHQTLWYQTPADIPEVMAFYRHVLGNRGWKEVAAEQQGIFNSNLKFRQDGHVLILRSHQTRRNPTQPKNLLGANPGSRFTIDEKVTDVSLVITDYFDMRTLPIYNSPSWELVQEASHRLRYHTDDSIVACEVRLLKIFPSAGWVYLDGGSSTSKNRRYLSFAKNGCKIDARIRTDRANPEALEIEVTCGVGITMPIPADSNFVSLRGLPTAKSKLSIPDLRATFDTQMQESHWLVERLDTNSLLRTIYTRGLQEVAYRFDVHEGQTVVTEEPHREWMRRNAENARKEIRAVNLPTPGAVTPPQYGRVVDRTKAVEFVSSNSWDQLRTTYIDFMNHRGYGTKTAGEKMAPLYFENDTKHIRLSFATQADGLGVKIDGPGLRWPNPLPSEKAILRSYSNWLEIKGRDFSLDHLHEFEGEMLKILGATNQSNAPEG